MPGIQPTTREESWRRHFDHIRGDCIIGRGTGSFSPYRMYFFFLCILSLALYELQASAHLVETQKPTDDEALLILAAASVMVFTVTACIKWFISGQLQSSTLMKDAISSFAVAVLSLGVCISASAYKADHHVWWFDAVVALITSVLLFTYGARTLFCHGHHWWQLSWWTEDLSGTDSEGQHLLGVGPQGESDSKTS